MKYRPDIDGLRAVAILAVLLFHAGASMVSGGYVGVDVFFVISGYVIASVIHEDLRRKNFSVWRFYSRRIRRLFPALFAMLVMVMIVGWFVLLPTFYRSAFDSMLAASVFVSNIYFWLQSDYFSADNFSKPFLHTWSLAVEEQYYLFVPIIMYFVFKYMRRRWNAVFLPLLFISLALSAVLTVAAPIANFYLLPTRLWELVLGLLLALNPPKLALSRAINDVLAGTGLLLIAYAVFAFTNTTPYPGLRALFPCLGAAFIIYASKDRLCFVGRLLSTSPMVGIGRISYSLYLIHWPVVVFFYFRTLAPPTASDVLPIVSISLLLSIISWKYIEQPFRHLDGKIMQRRLLAGGAAAAIAFSLIGWIGSSFDGFPSRFPAAAQVSFSGFKAQKIASKERWRIGDCFFWSDPNPKNWQYDKCQITRGQNKTALLWGDSFAAQYVPGIEENKDHIPYNIIEYTAASCPPILSYQSPDGKCRDFNSHALAIIREHQIDTVVLSADWARLKPEEIEQLRSTLTALDQRDIKVYVVGQSPAFSIDVQVLAFSKSGTSQDAIDKANVSFDADINSKLKIISGPHAFIDPMPKLCDGSICPYRDHGKFLFSDFGHFSVEGSQRAVRIYFPLFKSNTKRMSFVQE